MRALVIEDDDVTAGHIAATLASEGIASDRHAAILHGALGHKVLGTLRHDDSLVLPSRHLGLVQAEENQDLENFIEMGYDFVLDADVTPGETDDGEFLVFVVFVLF